MSFIYNLLELSLEAAPWLVLGLALGGLMKALIPTDFLQRHLKGKGLSAITKATILGAPLPLCSCGVIPAALGLRKAGASKPATAAFLVSTPETGIDSISITYALMGPFMAMVRPIAALMSAMVTGLLVAVFDPLESASSQSEEVDRSCCDSDMAQQDKSVIQVGRDCCESSTNDVELDEVAESCCSSEKFCGDEEKVSSETWLSKAWGGVVYAFTTLLDDIILWLAVGMLFAALTKTFLPPEFLTQWGQGIGAMFIMLLAGIPMYICATASTPIAAGLMMSGVSPGVALVLLMTGPATNISTLGVISKELGQRSMWLYLLGVGATAIIAGLLVDAWVNNYSIDITAQLHADHERLPEWLQWGALLLLVVTVFRKLPAKIGGLDKNQS